MTDRAPATATDHDRRLSTGVLCWAAGVLATLLLAASTTNSLAAFAASIAPGVGPARAGALTMTVAGPDGADPCSSTDGTGRQANAATCSATTRYGSAAMAPERPITTTMVVTNHGSRPASGFTLEFGPCHSSGHSTDRPAATSPHRPVPDLCRWVNLSVTHGTAGSTTQVVDLAASTLAQIGRHGAYVLPRVAAGASIALTLRTTLSSGGGNDCQGLTADQSITLEFTG